MPRKKYTRHEEQAKAAGMTTPTFDHIIPIDTRDAQDWGRKKRLYEQRWLMLTARFRRGLTAQAHLLHWNFSPGFDADETLKKLRPIMVGPVIKIQTKMGRLRAWIYKCRGRDGRLQYRTFLNANYPEKRANWIRRSRGFLYQNELPEMICILVRACQWISDDMNVPMPEVLMQMASTGFVFDKPNGEATITTSYDDARKLYQEQQERYDYEQGKLVEATNKRGKTVYSAKSLEDPTPEEE